MRFQIDLTRGSIGKNLFQFSMPLILINVLQAVYNVADMALAGHLVGTGGMAAINTSGQIMNIILVLTIGFSNGISIVTGQLVGAGQQSCVRTVIKTVVPCFAALAAVVSGAAACLCDPMLRILHIPPAVFAEAREYMLICLCGTIGVYLYNSLAGVLRGLGDSFHPMMFVCISTGTNIVLDYLLMGPLHMGVKGAALATVTAQWLSMALVFVYIKRNTEFLKRTAQNSGFDKTVLKMIVKIGLPQAFQFTATQFSILIIAGLVNTYGTVAAAAVGASNKAGTFAQLPGQALNAGVLTVTAQNLPKNNYSRILKSMFLAMGTGLVVSCIFFGVSAVRPSVILGIFSNDAEVLEMGRQYLVLMAAGCVTENIIYTSTGVVSGAGYTHITMAAAMLSALFRIIFALILQQATDLGVIGLGTAVVLAPVIPVIVMAAVLISGKWKKSALSEEYQA